MRTLAKQISLGLVLLLGSVGPIAAQSNMSADTNEDPTEGGKFVVVEARDPNANNSDGVETKRFYVPTSNTIREAKGGAFELRKARRLSGQPEGSVGICLRAINGLVDYQFLLGIDDISQMRNWNIDNKEDWLEGVGNGLATAAAAVEDKCREVLDDPSMIVSAITGWHLSANGN